MNKEHLQAYILCLKNNECYAGFALRLRQPIAKARQIARKLVANSAEMLSDLAVCEQLGIPECHGQKLRPLRKERRVKPDDLLAIKAGVFTILEFYGIADVAEDGNEIQYVCDSVKV